LAGTALSVGSESPVRDRPDEGPDNHRGQERLFRNHHISAGRAGQTDVQIFLMKSKSDRWNGKWHTETQQKPPELALA